MNNIKIRFGCDLKTLPIRVFRSKFDKLLNRIPPVGKLLSSLFGIFELYILELLRRLDRKFSISFKALKRLLNHIFLTYLSTKN